MATNIEWNEIVVGRNGTTMNVRRNGIIVGQNSDERLTTTLDGCRL